MTTGKYGEFRSLCHLAKVFSDWPFSEFFHPFKGNVYQQMLWACQPKKDVMWIN